MSYKQRPSDIDTVLFSKKNYTLKCIATSRERTRLRSVIGTSCSCTLTLATHTDVSLMERYPQKYRISHVGREVSMTIFNVDFFSRWNWPNCFARNGANNSIQFLLLTVLPKRVTTFLTRLLKSNSWVMCVIVLQIKTNSG